MVTMVCSTNQNDLVHVKIYTPGLEITMDFIYHATVNEPCILRMICELSLKLMNHGSRINPYQG